MFQASINWFTYRIIEIAARFVAWPRAWKRALVIVGDGLLCVAAVWLAFSLRLGEWRLFDWPVLRFSLTALALWYPVALWRGVYRAIFRYTGRGAIVTLTGAAILMSVPLVVIYVFRGYPGVPRTVALMQPLLFLAMISTARIVGRYAMVDLFHSRPVGGEIRRVLIYGAGRTGRQLASSLTGEAGTQLVGFIDDDPGLDGQRLDGVPVHHARKIEQIIRQTAASDVLLALNGASHTRRQEIVKALDSLPVAVKILPPMREFISGKVTVSALRPIDVEDLLGREPVRPDAALLHLPVAGKCVMVTGAGGSIGSEICRQALVLGARRLIIAELSEVALYEIEQTLLKLRAERSGQPGGATVIVPLLVNAADAAATRRTFAAHRPETVFHAAAYKHVPLVESNVLAAVENNILGTRNVALAAQEHGVERFILVSTDKAVRPPNVMGASKRVCELLLQALAAQSPKTVFSMVRFGNVLGSSGSVVPLFRRQIAGGGPVTVTDRAVTRYFMTIPEAAQLVIQAGGMATGGEVYVLDMGEPVRILDLAITMIKLAGLAVRGTDDLHGDIAITEIGLRPGEKLHEELLIGSGAQPTNHPRIMTAREDFIPLVQLNKMLGALHRAITEGDEEACWALLQVLVPTLKRESSATVNVVGNRTGNPSAIAPQAEPPPYSTIADHA